MSKGIIVGSFLVILLVTSLGSISKPLPQLLKPNQVVVDEKQVYIADGLSILVYSVEDLKFIKKFGREGEGPGEFIPVSGGKLSIDIKDEYIFVDNGVKLLFFTKGGKLVKEHRVSVPVFSGNFHPIGRGFVGHSVIRENNKFYRVITTYKPDLTGKKELFRMENFSQPTGKARPLKGNFAYAVSTDSIFIAGENGFVINVYNGKGEKTNHITQDPGRVKFTDADCRAFLEYLELIYKIPIEAGKKRVIFPEYFPCIRSLSVDATTLYVGTWKKKGDKLEYLIFNTKGEYLKKIYLHHEMEYPFKPSPSCIKGGKYYQLVEKNEEWQLQVEALGTWGK